MELRGSRATQFIMDSQHKLPTGLRKQTDLKEAGGAFLQFTRFKSGDMNFQTFPYCFIEHVYI